MADSLVTGAKKKADTVNPYKNNLIKCYDGFNRNVLSYTPAELASKIIKMSFQGEIEESLIRPIAWKILLKTLPSTEGSTLKNWVDVTLEQRSAFKKKIKALSSLKGLSGDPLGGGSGDTKWNKVFEENEVKKLINLDVNRTYQDNDLFCTPYIKDMLSNILFIWAKENKVPSYHQGMNEILAILLYAIYPYYNEKSKKAKKEELYSYLNEPKTNYKELYDFFYDEKELQCDLYCMFTNIMKIGVTKFFESNTDPSAVNDGDEKITYTNWCCLDVIDYKLKHYDSRLYNHFKNIDMDCIIVVQRWLKCLFNREFHPKDVEVLWDGILSDEYINRKNSTQSLSFVQYLCVSLIIYIRDDLIRKDQNDSFKRLFKYPPIESPIVLLKLALKIREDLQRKGIPETKPLTPKESAKAETENKKSLSSSNVKQGVSSVENNKNSSGSNILGEGKGSPHKSVTNKTPDPVSSRVPASFMNTNSSVGLSSHSPVAESSSNKFVNSSAVNALKIVSTQMNEMISDLDEILKKYKPRMEVSDKEKIDFIIDKMKKLI